MKRHTHKPFASRQMAAEGNRLQQKKQKAAESRTQKQHIRTHTHTQKPGQSEDTTPQDHTEGREWRAKGKGHALGTWQMARVQAIIATNNTGGHRNTPDV